MILALAAAAASTAGASAQGVPPAADHIFAAPDIGSPVLSPSGNQLVFLSNQDRGGDIRSTIVLVDLTGGAPQVVRAVPLASKAKWIQWAGEDRLLVSMSAPLPIRGGMAWLIDSAGRIFITDELDLSFITSMTTDGEDPVVLFASTRRLGVTQTQLDYVVDFLPDDPDHILMGVRSRRGAELDVYRTNVLTGRARRVDSGRDETLAWFTDTRGVTVMRLDHLPNRDAIAVLIREEDGRRWTRVAENSVSNFTELHDGVTWVARAEAVDEALVMAEDESTGRTGLFRFNLLDGALASPVWTHPEYDVASVYADSVSGRALALTWADERTHVEVFDPALRDHWPALTEFFGDELAVWPVQRAGSKVLLQASGPLEPDSYYIYDLGLMQVDRIGARLSRLHEAALASVSVHHYTAADGTELFGYLTTPAYPAANPVPLVVLPHGGPEARDYYGFDPLAQLIAAAGFAVFQPQFRGSSGFGRAFAEAGHGEWAGLIQSDITDGVRSVLESKSIDASRVCIAGWSFGGYAALMQAAMHPDLYQCAAAGAAVTDPYALLVRAEELVEGEHVILRAMMGGSDQAALAPLSAVERASQISIPVLLVHGRQDGIVPVEQSEMMEAALRDAGVDVDTFYFDAGHALDNQADMQRAMFQITRFLTRHIDPR
ncbi:MAG: prolyl oligopeptidase family serine peptidase [Alphaproteobacteria bacterium]|nr:prolyl oligopeptidase family serine peptidase [Alphaproteobacteria bacterium]